VIKIVRAKVEDSEELRKLETRIWRERVTNKYDLSDMIRFSYAYIAKDENKTVGGIYGYKTKDGKFYVCDWFVDKRYRKRGIGSKLYKRLIKDIKLPIVSFLDPNYPPTIKAHKKLGFKILKKVKNAYGRIKGLEDGYQLLAELRKK
jgi:ribosomal protein S18 acetylase RimI-like enzyme